MHPHGNLYPNPHNQCNLEQASMVTSERQSRKIIYKADIEKIGSLISFLLNDCCANHPDIRACCLDRNPECCQ